MKNTEQEPTNTHIQFVNGSNDTGNGWSFRVWAPNATAVCVIGDFNNWDPKSSPLSADHDGFWQGLISEAKEGQEYKYMLDTPQGQFFRQDLYARQVTGSQGNSILISRDYDWQCNDFQMPAWNELVFYEVHTGSFSMDDQGNPGTFDQLAQKLPYLRDLGINVLQLMPIMEFPGAFSWGYNPVLPFAVENKYGGAKALKNLIDQAHAHNIAVVIDVVYNHFGPQDMDMWRYDGWHENEGGGIYFYNDERAKTPWGDTRPDYGRPQVRQFILENVMMWLDEFRMDGLRFDSVSHTRNIRGDNGTAEDDLPDGWSLMQWINEEIENRFPWKIRVAEDLCQNDWISKPSAEGGAGFNSQWDNDFIHTLHRIVTQTDDQNRDVEDLERVLVRYYNNDAFHRMVYSESHDEVSGQESRNHRLTVEVSGQQDPHSWLAKKRTTLAAAMVLTCPAIPMLFQGQEFLEDRPFHDSIALDWNKLEVFGSITNLYRKLIFLRRNAENTTKGLSGHNINCIRASNQDNIIAYLRFEEGGPRDTCLIIANFSANAIIDYKLSLPDPGIWKLRFNSDAKLYDDSFGDTASLDVEAFEQDWNGMPFCADFTIGAYSLLIYSQD